MARKTTEKKEKAPRGKAGNWLTEDGLLLIAAWVRDGATDEQLAKKMQISRSTLSEWKLKHKDFAEAVRKSKEIVDVEVENALLKRATGYTYFEEMAFKCKQEYWDAQGRKCSKEEVQAVKVLKEMPPDPKAAQYWLNNRKPEAWKANRDDEQEGDGTVEVVIQPEDMEQFE